MRLRIHKPHLTLFGGVLALAPMTSPAQSLDLHVSPTGNNSNPGSAAKSLATLARALETVRQQGQGKSITIQLHGGTYYLADTLKLTAEHSGTSRNPLIIEPYMDDKVVISGGQRLTLDWKPFRDGIFQAAVPPDLDTEELFVNGKRQILARYPNFNPKERIFNGYASDAISKERVARWSDPSGGTFHAMHPAEWGDFTWRITGKKPDGELTMEGGWQNNRSGGPHPQHRFVEGIFEELDAPGEWFLNRKTHVLYYYPPSDVDLGHAVVEATKLRTLISFQGTKANPVHHVVLRGITFRQAARTVMDTREPLLRTDWAIYRGGAVFLEGTEDCRIEKCHLDQLGGNAIFVNHYNRRLTLQSLHISQAGATGIHFVGDPKAARSALFNYEQTQPLQKIDRTPGPQSDEYPADCLVDDCLIELTGRTEKQTAGINIDLSRRITIRDCSIYDMPRAGINIGDGCWGGHIVEGCDIFDTVKETGDHGSFNSWGRERFWNPDIETTNRWVAQEPNLPFLDATEPIILRHNRWRCDHGWDIDLDDGSTHFLIENNLCLNGGIKNREGYGRIVTNNVIVNNGLHPHVWYANSGDAFRHNIVWTTYAPALMYAKPWPKELNQNFVHIPNYPHNAPPSPATSLQALSGRDVDSISGDAQFVDPSHGDYRVKEGSPAKKVGFKNFPMDRFGVRSKELRAMARTPVLPDPSKSLHEQSPRSDRSIRWLGALIRNIVGQGEMSAFGTPGENGVLVVEIPKGTDLERCGIEPNDVILGVGEQSAFILEDLAVLTPKKGEFKLVFLRHQQRHVVKVTIQ